MRAKKYSKVDGMVVFKRKQSALAVTIGDQLRMRRRSHRLSLQAISNALLIPVQHIRHLEADQFHAIPEVLYRELFLKTYATYLELEWGALKTQYDAECVAYARKTTEKKHSIRSVKSTQFIVAPQLLKTLLVSFAIVGCFAYLMFLGYRAVSPPSLALWSPTQDELSGIDQVTVKGKTNEQARLTINGEPVMIRRDGTFEQSVVLSEGINVIKVGASKKYSKEHIEERRVIYRRENALRPDTSLFKSN